MPGGGGGGGSQTVGYRYYLGMHLVVCHGPVDAVTEIQSGERVAWTGNVTATAQIAINAPELFGGDKREGGVVGAVDVEFGDAAQLTNSYLAAKLGTPQPGYRGVLGLVFRQVQMSSNNPNPKPIAILVRRIFDGWNPADAAIGVNANPAHIIYECLTNSAWGMAYPTSAIDEASFGAAADTLVAEGFGLSLIWSEQVAIEEFIRDVLDHVSGVLVASPITGKFELKLARDDYSPGSLPVFDESNVIELESYQRAGWGETVNEIVLVYTRSDNYRETSITVQDLANVQIQGVVSETRRYPGIVDDALAARVAIRDLRVLSTPRAKVRLRANRDAWNLTPNDVFKLDWADLGLSGLICRVASIDTGDLHDGSIRVEAIEDVFSFDDVAYTVPEPIGWVDPTPLPADATPRLVTETTYWRLSQELTASELAAFAANETVIEALAGRPSGAAINYDLQMDGAGNAGPGDFTPHASINEALVPELQSSVTLAGGIDLDIVRIGSYAYIAADGSQTAAEQEAVEILALDPVLGTATLRRGVLDTVPRTYAPGMILWFAEDFFSTDRAVRTFGQSATARFGTRTPLGVLPFASATPFVENFLGERQARPYPPGNLKINGVAYPEAFSGDLVISWARRNRLTQTAALPRQTDADVTPEAGVSTNLRIYGELPGNVFVENNPALAGTGYTYTQAEELADNLAFQGLNRLNHSIRIEVEAEKGSDDSYQRHDFRVNRAGWGFHWGKYYGSAG